MQYNKSYLTMVLKKLIIVNFLNSPMISHVVISRDLYFSPNYVIKIFEGRLKCVLKVVKREAS